MNISLEAESKTRGGDRGTDRSRSSVYLVAWASVLEIIRRKDIYVLFILVGIYLVFVLAARVVGIESDGAAQFLLNLGISAAFFLSAVLTATAAARQLTRELEDRTIYPLLAKPVSRFEVLVGKWAAVTFVGSSVMAVLSGITFLAVPLYEGLSAAMLAQALLAQALSLSVLAGIVLFASVWIPRAVAIPMGLGLYLTSGFAVGFLKTRVSGSAAGAVEWLAGYIPNFSMLNLAQRFTDGGPALGVMPMLALVLYAALVSACFLLAASWAFERKPL